MLHFAGETTKAITNQSFPTCKNLGTVTLRVRHANPLPPKRQNDAKRAVKNM